MKDELDEMLEKPSDDAPQQEENLSLEEVMKRIKTMTQQRDKLNEAISAHKKIAQRMIGRL